MTAAQLDMIEWLAADPAVPVLLHRIDPARNMRRFYALAIERTLFDEFALVARWGRIGSPRGQMRTLHFDSQEDAARAMQRQMQAKARRGYVEH